MKNTPLDFLHTSPNFYKKKIETDFGEDVVWSINPPRSTINKQNNPKTHNNSFSTTQNF